MKTIKNHGFIILLIVFCCLLITPRQGWTQFLPIDPVYLPIQPALAMNGIVIGTAGEGYGFAVNDNVALGLGLPFQTQDFYFNAYYGGFWLFSGCNGELEWDGEDLEFAGALYWDGKDLELMGYDWLLTEEIVNSYYENIILFPVSGTPELLSFNQVIITEDHTVTVSIESQLTEDSWSQVGTELTINVDYADIYITGISLMSNDGVDNFSLAEIDPDSIGVETMIITSIDIKPGSDINCINFNDHGVIPVAILGTPDLDVSNIDPSTVMLGGVAVKAVGKSNKLLAHQEDINNDGLIDLVVQIEDDDGAFIIGETIAVVTGKLYDGTSFRGTDIICIVP